MLNEGPRTIHLRWVRSGIGFSHRQKEIVRSLGFRRLNEVLERPDTAPIRGLVAKVAHLVEIVDRPPVAPAWASIPEYTLRPSEVPPLPVTAPPAETVEPGQERVPASEIEEAVAESAAEKAEEVPAQPISPSAKSAKAAKLSKPAAKKSKAAKPAGPKKGRAGKEKAAKPAKKGKK